MRRFTSLGLLVLLFYSCIGIEENNQLLDGHRPEMVITDSTISDSTAEGEFEDVLEKIVHAQEFENSPQIETFSEIPKDIDGCSCSFALNEEGLANWDFIYVDDYHEEKGYMKLNGNLIRLDLKFPQKNIYQVTFEIIEEKLIGQELLQQTGIMTIKGPINEIYTANYIGNCGC